jgi:hypothetical protein
MLVTFMPEQDNIIEEPDHPVELAEHIDLHKQGWKAQTFGFLLIYSFIAAAALGLFGDGLLSNRTVSFSKATLKYDYFQRFENRMKLTIITATETPGSQIAFSTSYLSKFKIDAIVPEPAESTFKQHKLVYTFKGNGTHHIVFYLVPQQQGRVEGTITINNEEHGIKHLIFP